MSSQQRQDAPETVDEVRRDEQARQAIESLAGRDDQIGAFARVVLDLADRDEPDPEDLRDAELSALADRLEDDDDEE